jgi:RNA polymerase sigma-70 factor (ECF subfamily)
MSSQPHSDIELIAGLQQPGFGRRSYEDSLYLQFRYFIEEGLRKFNLTREESFSCYSDSVLHVIQNIRSGAFEGRSMLKTYLYQVFHNKCVDQVRKNTTHKGEVNRSAIVPEMLGSLSDPAKTIVQELTDRADVEDLKRRLKELGDNCRKMLLLSAEGYPDKEIANIMEFKTAGVAKTSRLRCMEKLRRLYTNKS